ncbi:tRNA pseudouridine(38-40) synthase TruA [Aureivirga sp. CE67]|uniref:tRNA pseudouridine(38-40) synthase TruA n=1 Tax=Aureivirga sp. CE67 TaxID=1788983 RepID=UPI0018C9856F|nr:tRNA pseudouridine(38-40) synthase TruA [Aureivirga sp. CE67]
MRYFIELAYNGKNFHGWQIQPDAISVQEVIEKGLSKILREEIQIVGAGRTDTGVHASQMFAHFETDKDLSKEDYAYKLNAVLPDEVVIYEIFPVTDEAHARFDATSRSYEYRIFLGRDPFCIDTTLQFHHKKLNVELMNEAAKVLFNHINFKCFSKSKTDVRTYNCKIYEAKWVLEEKHLTFHVSADRFLRNMVRAIVGTLLEIGLEKKKVEDLEKIILSENRSKAGVSVPAKGLFLTKVEYPSTIRRNE